MKTLADILKHQAVTRSELPSKSTDGGYGGELDGDVVLLATFGRYIFDGAPIHDFEDAKKIRIPSAARLHWAKYEKEHEEGWYGVVGIWESELKREPTSDLGFSFMGL
jgi:hypothetical protein